MLRMYCVANWFNLADEACEDMLYDTPAFRQFCGVDLGKQGVPDATIIAAPSSTKNQDKARDPEMRQTYKAGQWYFGMKAHIGVDSASGLIHSASVTAANEHDSQQLGNLLHGNETRL